VPWKEHKTVTIKIGKGERKKNCIIDVKRKIKGRVRMTTKKDGNLIPRLFRVEEEGLGKCLLPQRKRRDTASEDKRWNGGENYSYLKMSRRWTSSIS